jgi:hypothetical protein
MFLQFKDFTLNLNVRAVWIGCQNVIICMNVCDRKKYLVKYFLGCTLCTSAKLRIVTVLACLSVCTEQLGYDWMDFRQT